MVALAVVVAGIIVRYVHNSADTIPRGIDVAQQGPEPLNHPMSSAAATTSATVPRNDGKADDAATLVHCHAQLMRVLSQRAIVLRCESQNLSTSAFNACNLSHADDQEQRTELEAAASGCPVEAEKPEVFYRALRERALAGDIQAQHCFISGDFNSGGALPGDITADQMVDYHNLIPRLIDQAFERGDWEVVEWLSLGPILDVRDARLSTAYPITAWATAYKMTALLRLGATYSDEIQKLDKSLKYISDPSNGYMSAEEKRAADDWAARHFNAAYSATLRDRRRLADNLKWCE